MNKTFKAIKSILVIIVLCIMLFSCINRIEDINAVSDWNERPIISAKDIEILYSDSAIVKAKIIAPVLIEFEKTKDEESYTEFPKGMEVYFYNNLEQLESMMTSGYAKYFKSKKLFEARNNVEVYNFLTNEKLNTEQMFWDEQKGIIYSDKFTRITKDNDVTYGEDGFTADQTFTSYTIKGGGGTYHTKKNSDTK